MPRPVEVAGAQPHLEQHPVEGLLRQQDGAEDRGLGLLVVRRNAVAGGFRLNRGRH